MAYGQSIDDGAWSKSGAAVAIFAMAAAASAWVVALRPVRFSTPALALAWLVAVGGVCVIARARIPTPVKAVLLAGVCGSLLACFATQDVLGLRKVEVQTASALADVDAHAGDRLLVRANVTVTGDGVGAGAIADAVANDARATLSGADVGVSARVSPVGDDRAYRLHWTLIRDDERLWCGVITETPGPAKPLFADFGRQLADAARRSRGGPLACAQ